MRKEIKNYMQSI